MTTLSDVMAAVRAARAATPLDTEREDAAHEALADYILTHAADIAERERLEASAIDEYRQRNTFGPAYYELIRFLVSRAATEDAQR